jgi:hypothetical protein
MSEYLTTVINIINDTDETPNINNYTSSESLNLNMLLLLNSKLKIKYDKKPLCIPVEHISGNNYGTRYDKINNIFV